MYKTLYTQGLSVCNYEHREKVLQDARKVKMIVKHFNNGKFVELVGTKEQFQKYDMLG